MISAQNLETLKSADPDRWRSAMFADKTGRERLLLLYAFHYELAKVPEFVSEPMLGEIRYQWWRDAVEEIYSGGNVRRHEVTTPLTDLFRHVDMPRFWVDRLIDGRARDLDPTPFDDVEAARYYSRETSGMLMQMAVKCLGGEPDEAVLKAGEAWGLTGLVRGWRFYHKSMLAKLSFDDVINETSRTYLEAKSSLDQEDSAFPAIAYAALIPKYIKRLTESGHNAAKDAVPYAPLLKQFRLVSAVARGKI